MQEIEHNAEAIRTLYATDEFDAFYSALDDKTRVKFKQAFDIAQTIFVLSAKFVKRLVDTDLYEMRVSVGSNEYRTVLFAIDNENIILSTKIILVNGFLKKSTKDYEKQIKKAERILKDLEV